ncbi:hypothetical protein [Chryseobacterium takakiae]|nr:hypothetical protein [Chryseobacterium takakiae]
MEQELQQMVSDSKELDIRTKIEMHLTGWKPLQTIISRAIYKQKGGLGV